MPAVAADPRILLVDDDPAILQTLRHALASLGTLYAATTGREAVQLLGDVRPDLVLLDAELPDLSGFQVLAALRAHPELSEIPVLFITRHRDQKIEQTALELGAVDFITKPVRPAIVATRVKTQLRLKAVTDRLRQYTEQLEAANDELDAFTYAVAHDLRAPLRAISAYSQILLEEHADAIGERTYLDRITGAAARMGRLIDDLLRLSRNTHGALAHGPVDLAVLAREICLELSRAAPTHDVQLVIADRLPAAGDPGLLRVVLENLLSNAWKFTASRSSARIEVGAHDRAFFVRDNGSGFDVAHADRLFTPFYRMPADRPMDGFGIGLATARRIVRRHNGRIWAESAPGEGATFWFTLDQLALAPPRAVRGP